MKRRDFLRSVGVASAALAFPKADRLFADEAAPAVTSGWRTFEITTRVAVANPSGETRVWLPAALVRSTPFQRTLGNKFEAVGGAAHLVENNKADALGIVAATFPAGVPPVLTLTSRIQTKNYAVALSAPERPKADHAELVHCLQPNKFIPIDGIVKETADRDHQGRERPMSTRRGRSTSGSSRTPFAIRRRAAAESAIFASCWSPRTWVASAPT